MTIHKAKNKASNNLHTSQKKYLIALTAFLCLIVCGCGSSKQKITVYSDSVDTERSDSSDSDSNTETLDPSDSDSGTETPDTTDSDSNTGTPDTTPIPVRPDSEDSEADVPDTTPIADSEISATSPTPPDSGTALNIRDNTPVIYTPVASGTSVYTCSVATIDASNASEGYIMVKYSGSIAKVKLQITLEGSNTYTYNLTAGDYEAFPLSSNSGKYSVGIYENVSGTNYSVAMFEDINVTISNTYGAYLYPNQYCSFTSSSAVVAKGKELAKNAADELEVVSNVYNYMIENIAYDYPFAESVGSGYTPDPDTTLSTKMGICLDYASLMTAMLRTQGIPTRLEVGNAGDAYHAWISTYIKDIGWINGVVQFDGKSWTLMDPTFGANSSESALRDFIGDGDNYVTKYYY